MRTRADLLRHLEPVLVLSLQDSHLMLTVNVCKNARVLARLCRIAVHEEEQNPQGKEQHYIYEQREIVQLNCEPRSSGCPQCE